MENIGNNLIYKRKTRKMGFLYAPKHKHMTPTLPWGACFSPLGENFSPILVGYLFSTNGRSYVWCMVEMEA